jgi:hypothetical protein
MMKLMPAIGAKSLEERSFPILQEHATKKLEQGYAEDRKYGIS